MAGRERCEEGLQKIHTNWSGSILHGIKNQKEKSGQCPYDRDHPLALQFAYKYSNQCEDIYSECGSSKHVNRKIFIIESRIASSSERDENQIMIWKKDKRYHMSEMKFDENIAESRKMDELKKDEHHSFVSFVVHTSIIEKGWIDAS